MLADAFASNPFLTGFTCIQNPHNFDPETYKYKPTASVNKLEEAARHSLSPSLTVFQNKPLSSELTESRSYLQPSIYAALRELGFSKNILLEYTQNLVRNGCGTLKLLSSMNDHRLKDFGITHELHQQVILRYIDGLQNSTLSRFVLECPATISDALLDAGLSRKDADEYTSKLESFGCTSVEMLFLMKPDWLKAARITNELHIQALLKYTYSENGIAAFNYSSYETPSTTDCKPSPFSDNKIIPNKDFQRKQEWCLNCDCMLMITLIEFLCLFFSVKPRERFLLFVFGTILLMTKSYYLSF